MKKTDIFLVILAVVLVVGMLLTVFFGRGSRHGYGFFPGQERMGVVLRGKSGEYNKNLTKTVVVVNKQGEWL
ncbi:MAG: hypothetical protein P1S46_08235 [bacterium]|nr:hypothetical protein [bacterium]MDT8396602.1 hypothetical protein [bacterium]